MSESSFQIVYPRDEKINIEKKTSLITFDKKHFMEFNEKKEKMKKVDKETSFFLSKIKKLEINSTHYIFRLFNIYDDNGNSDPDVSTGFIVLDDKEYDNSELCCKYIETKQQKNYKSRTFVNKKFKKLVTTMVGEEIYQNKLKDKTYCDRSSIVKKIRLNILYNLFDSLEKGGNFLMAHIYNICDNDIIEFFYLASILFEKVTILFFDDFFIYCENFQYENRVTKNELKNIINKPYTVTPKINYDNLVSFLQNCIIKENQKIDLLYDKKYDEYLQLYTMDLIRKAETFKISKNFIKILQKKLIEIFRHVYLENKFVRIHSAIKSEEGASIQEIIKKYNIKKSIEVGMAFGISAFYILSTSSNISLISIDPFQTTQWNSSGIELLKKMNLKKNHKLIEKKSHVALPELLEKNGENSFDFIFIDGFHTFDYTLVDFFYAMALVKVGGVILVDDALHPGVAKCIKYIDTNYNCMKRIQTSRTQAGYIKIKNDDREWSFHHNF